MDGDAVADLDVVGRAGDAVVDRDAAEVAGLVRHGAALDEARDLEVFIETHGEMLLSRKCLRKIDLDGNINYVNPETGTNTLWTNSNATKHMGEYVSRFGDESWSIGTRSQAMLESYSASLNKAMETIGTETPGRYFGTYGNWELGINTETGVVYHARMIN